MKVWLLVVGRPGALLADAIAEYETRARRYWSLEVAEVREERARAGMTEEQIRTAESERLLARAATGLELVALTRAGTSWSSEELAAYLQKLAVGGSAGAVFCIGGALGLSQELLARAQRRISLSSLTLPHELARLVWAEQIYRAGTIARGEPYHKGTRAAKSKGDSA